MHSLTTLHAFPPTFNPIFNFCCNPVGLFLPIRSLLLGGMCICCLPQSFQSPTVNLMILKSILYMFQEFIIYIGNADLIYPGLRFPVFTFTQTPNLC